MKTYDHAPASEKYVRSSHGADLDPRHHFASTYSASFGGHELKHRAYHPLAASIALGDERQVVASGGAVGKQATAFTKDLAFSPALLLAGPPNGTHYLSETRKSYNRPSSEVPKHLHGTRMIASPAYKDIKVTSSGFTKNFGKSSNGAVDDSSSLSQQESVTKSTFRGLQEQKRGAECILCCCGGGGNTGVMLKEPLLTATLASEAVSALVKTYPKPGVVGAHTIPTLHKYGDGKFVERDQVEIQPSPRVDYKDIRITDDGFTRGSGSTGIVQQQPATFVASRTTASAPEAGSQRPQHIETNFGNMTGAALIHPMNELRTKKIWLNGSSSPTRHGNAAEISPKVGQQPFTLQASNTTPASPQSMTHRHISGDLLNTGDAEFLSTRGKHLPRDFYTSEQKAQFRGQRDGPTFAYRDAKITESAFTHCTTLKTSPW